MIVDNIISRDGILPQSTKIVTTHNKVLLAAAEHVVVVRLGSIDASGTMENEKVRMAAKEFVGWDEAQHHQQQQQQPDATRSTSASMSQHPPPLALSGCLFDQASTMRTEMREHPQKDV